MFAVIPRNVIIYREALNRIRYTRDIGCADDAEFLETPASFTPSTPAANDSRCH